ncbi:MAG: hypothetical protein AAF404_17375, partial [Pseudomonadota bacterium]
AFIWAYHYSQSNHRGAQGLSGLLLAIAWAKYSLTFPLTLIFINQKNWIPITVAAAIHLLLTVVAAAQLGLYPQEFFFSSVAVVLMGSGTGFVNIAAVAMLLHIPTAVAMTAISVALIGSAYLVSRVQNVQPLTLLSVLALLSYALFYHHNYDFIVLIFLAWCIATERLTPTAMISSVALIVISWFGLWFANELTPWLPTATQGLLTAIDGLQVVVFYLALLLLTNNLRTNTRRERIADGVLAF